MNENPQFHVRYFQSLSELDGLLKSGTVPRSGEVLSFIIRDYLNTIVNWDTEPVEAYRAAFAACRTYILPMNPPRIELENAVRLLFREHGIGIKKARTFEKGRNKEAVPETRTEEVQLELDQGIKKRRRHRRKKPSDKREPL